MLALALAGVLGCAPAMQDKVYACLGEPTGAGAWVVALKAAQARIGVDPNDAASWTDAGMAWVEGAQLRGSHDAYHTAERCMETAQKLAPEDPRALELGALVLQSHHRFDESLAQADRALQLEPERPLALAIRSDVLVELGRYDEAVASAQLLVDLKPGPEAYVRASHLRFLHGDTEGARALMHTALQGSRDPRSPGTAAWAFCQAGQLYAQAGDDAGADALYAEALRWVPDYPGALRGRARAALAMGRPADVLVLLEEHPDRSLDLQDLWLLADAETALGHADLAETHAARLVRDGMTHDPLTVARYFTTKNLHTDLALQIVAGELATRPSVEVEDAQAWALYRSGDFAAARLASDRALRLGTPDASFMFHAGAIRIAQGQVEEGRALVAQALTTNPTFDVTGAREARELISVSP